MTNTTSTTSTTIIKDDKITVKVNGKLKEDFRKAATANGTNPTNLINQLMWDYLYGTTTTTNTNDEEKATTSTTSTNMTNKALEERLSSIEQRLEEKTDHQQVSELLAMATQPLWESFDYMGDKIEHLTPTEPHLESTNLIVPETDRGFENQIEGKFDSNSESTKQEGLTTSELKDHIGVPPTYISKWKNGKDIPKEDGKNWDKYQKFLQWKNVGTKNKNIWVELS